MNLVEQVFIRLSTEPMAMGSTFINPAPSCKFIQEGSLSGHYWIQNTETGHPSYVYCDMTMTRRCCDSPGKWMRVAHLDMTDRNQHCPSVFTERSLPVRACGKGHTSVCTSITFSVKGVEYHRVCGKIIGYQYAHTDAFWSYFRNRRLTLNDHYVDGVSLTHGLNPRKHIWTLAAALDEKTPRFSIHRCPCSRTTEPYAGRIPPYVGNDYFCDTGSTLARWQNRFYHENPLWDGSGCNTTSTCCSFNNPPWFCKTISEPTTDDIELRLCADGIEDVALESIEIYVQ